MPRSNKPSQKKAKRRKAEHHESEKQPSCKKMKIIPLAEPIVMNLQIQVPLLHNAAEPSLARPSNQPSIRPGQLLHPQQMFVPSGARPPRYPIMNLSSHQLQGLPNIRPGLRPQLIPMQTRTSTGIFYGQPGANIRQPSVVINSNFIPRPRFPIANVRPASGLNVPPTPQLHKIGDPTHIKEKPPVVERSYRCTECLERFPTVTKLENHQRIHREKPKGRRIQCSSLKCQSLFKDFDELDKHFREQHIQLNLVCEFCGKKFINHYDFNTHKKSHN